MKKFVMQVLSYVLVAVIAAGTAVCCCLMAPRDPMPDNKLDKLQALIDERFIGEYKEEDLLNAAASAMVQSLGDPWSYYMTPPKYDDYQDTMSNSYVGVGITIRVRDDGAGMDIIEAVPNGPSAEAGIQSGDILIAIAGTSVAGMTGDEARELIRGEEGTQVELTVLRESKELLFSVTRRSFLIPVATHKLLEGNIGIVTIKNFDSRCADETIAAIEAVRQAGATALILDVRNNPGGYKSELVKVLDYLLPDGEIFRSVDYRGKTDISYSDAKFLDMPMAVLINGNSYSAAEFFAAALDEYDAAVVVGEKTTGKGYFQQNYQLGDGSAVNLSVGKYYTPKGVSLAGVGLTPEKEEKVDEYTAYMIMQGMLKPEEDPQIMAAVNALKSAN